MMERDAVGIQGRRREMAKVDGELKLELSGGQRNIFVKQLREGQG